MAGPTWRQDSCRQQDEAGRPGIDDGYRGPETASFGATTTAAVEVTPYRLHDGGWHEGHTWIAAAMQWQPPTGLFSIPDPWQATCEGLPGRQQ